MNRVQQDRGSNQDWLRVVRAWSGALDVPIAAGEPRPAGNWNCELHAAADSATSILPCLLVCLLLLEGHLKQKHPENPMRDRRYF